jgi:hypothetical protein
MGRYMRGCEAFDTQKPALVRVARNSVVSPEDFLRHVAGLQKWGSGPSAETSSGVGRGPEFV